MIRALPAPLAIPWRTVALVLVAVPSVILSGVLIALLFLETHPPADWWIFTEAASRIGGGLYNWGELSPTGEPYRFRYSPLFAWAIAPFTALGLEIWRLLHIAVLALLPWRVALLTLAFAPFWYDVLHGNVLTFAFVLGFLALRGNRWATFGFLALAVLVPRPLMIPVAAWIAWKRPEWRLPVVGFAAVAALTLLYPGFVGALMGEVRPSDVLWPPAFIGLAWVPASIVLAAWLTWKGRPGMASIVIMPWVLPYHLLMGLLEARER